MCDVVWKILNILVCLIIVKRCSNNYTGQTWISRNTSFRICNQIIILLQYFQLITAIHIYIITLKPSTQSLILLYFGTGTFYSLHSGLFAFLFYNRLDYLIFTLQIRWFCFKFCGTVEGHYLSLAKWHIYAWRHLCYIRSFMPERVNIEA